MAEIKPSVPMKWTNSAPQRTVDAIKAGEVINNRFIVVRVLGVGGFGAVYEVDDDVTRQKAAMKVELNQPPPNEPDLTLETNVLKRLQKNEHFTRFLQHGIHRNIKYLVMQLVGENLTTLRKACPEKRFTYSTAHRAAVQMLDAIEHMHKCELLHRDIKPANFTIGYLKKDIRTIYLLDFGLVRKFTTKHGQIRPPRDNAPFRGTRRYASVNVLKSLEPGRQDDLLSWIYSVIEFISGNLPFSSEVNRVKLAFEKENAVERMFGQSAVPAAWRKIYEALARLKYADVPPYASFRQDLDAVAKEQKVIPSDPLDWEEPNGAYCAAIKQHLANPNAAKGSTDQRLEQKNKVTQVSTTGGSTEDNV